jgi:peptide/nickel transport system substrate-binding protein
MKRKIVPSKLVYLGIALCLMASMAIFGLAIGAPTPIQASAPRYGGILRLTDAMDGISIGYPPKIVGRVGWTCRHVSPAVETLFRSDKAGIPVPWLATGSTSNVAAKTLILTLRRDVKFHDGADFNAEAVKWNLDQCMSARSQGTEKFKSIDVIDNYTVRINLSDWDSTVIGNLTQPIGLMISPTAYKKNGEDWCAKNPVGTGAFQFVSWEKDIRTIYKKFDGYWQKGKPYLDRIEWTPITDPLTRQFSLRKGELDLALSMPPEDFVGFRKDGYSVISTKIGSGAISVIPDAANPTSPFADIRVRQAVQYAINSEDMVKGFFYGEVDPANQYLYKGHWGYNPSVVGYPYNPAKAKQLLAEAGYPNGFKTKLLYQSAIPELGKTCTAVQGYIKAVGIDVELDPATDRFTQTAFFGGKWEGLIAGADSSNPDAAVSLATRYLAGKSYAMMLKPDDFAKAIKDAIAAPDFETKQKLIQVVMKLMIDKYCLYIPLYFRSDAAISQPYLHNHGLLGTPNSALWTPEDAWLER